VKVSFNTGVRCLQFETRKNFFKKLRSRDCLGGEIRLQSFWRPDINTRFPYVKVGDSIPSDWPIIGVRDQ
jgi:hypothetical protein